MKKLVQRSLACLAASVILYVVLRFVLIPDLAAAAALMALNVLETWYWQESDAIGLGAKIALTAGLCVLSIVILAVFHGPGRELWMFAAKRAGKYCTATNSEF